MKRLIYIILFAISILLPVTLYTDGPSSSPNDTGSPTPPGADPWIDEPSTDNPPIPEEHIIEPPLTRIHPQNIDITVKRLSR